MQKFNVKLTPLVFYTNINTNGALDLYDAATHTGELTDQYLKDRAAFVLAKEKAYAAEAVNDARYEVERQVA